MAEIGAEIPPSRLRGPYSGGRHLFMTKGALKLRIPNPHRADVSKHLLAEILCQSDISSEEWEDA